MQILLGLLLSIISATIAGILTKWFEGIWARKDQDKSKSQPIQPSTRPQDYVLGFGFSAVFLLILYLIDNRWPLSIGWAITLVVGFFVFLILLFIIGYRLHIGLKVKIENIYFAIGFLLLSTLFFVDLSLPHYVSLSCPHKVNNRTALSGRTNSNQWSVFVLIRPFGSSGTFVQRAVGPGEDKRWKANCYFGGAVGERYHVYAVAIDGITMAQMGVSPSAEELERHAIFKTSLCLAIKVE